MCVNNIFILCENFRITSQERERIQDEKKLIYVFAICKSLRAEEIHQMIYIKTQESSDSMAWIYVCAVNIKSGRRCTEGFYGSFSLCLRTKFLIALHTHNLSRRRLLLFPLNGSFVLRIPPFNLCNIAKHKRSTNVYVHVWNWEHKTMGNLLMNYASVPIEYWKDTIDMKQ